MLKATWVLAIGAVLAAAPSQAQIGPRRTCDVVTVSSPDRPKVRERFSATKTLDLQFRMRVRRPDAEPHMLTLRVLTPKGHLYQELRVPYVSDPKHRTAPLSVNLPLAGTAIATSSLYGRWRVTPYLDESARPCGAATVFSIVK